MDCILGTVFTVLNNIIKYSFIKLLHINEIYVYFIIYKAQRY